MTIQNTYQPLGNFIRKVDNRNRDLKVTKLYGVNLQKEFIPSVANIIGTDLSTYKVIKRGQFGCKFMSVGRDGILPISLMTEDEPAIISGAYYSFEVNDENVLLPEYLMMWLRRPEFDRQLWFYSGGDVRGGVTYDDFCMMPIIIPPIAEQRAIVAEYAAVQHRMEVNKRLIAKLEETAQTLYKKMFVDGVDKENLPDGWKMGTLGEYCKKMTSGGTPNRNHNAYWNKKDFPWLKSGEVHNNVIIDVEEYISQEGLICSSAKLIPSGTVVMAMYGATAAQVGYLDCETTTNQACCNMICYNKQDAAFLFFHLLYCQDDIKRLANGGAQENLSQELIASQQIILFDDDNKKRPFVSILDHLILAYKEIKLCKELQSLLLARMGR